MEMLNSNFWTPKISVPSIEILNWRQIIDNDRVKKKLAEKGKDLIQARHLFGI